MSSSGQVLFEESRCFPAGYGPRSIQFSPDASQLAVGYKDGSIHIVDGLRGPIAAWKNYSIRPPADNPEAGARSLAYLARGKLLVGRDGGSLDMVTFTMTGDGEDDIRWEKTSLRPPRHRTKGDNPGGLTLVTVLDATTILASHRRGGAWLANRADVENGQPQWKQLSNAKDPYAGSGLVCAYALSDVPGRYLAVSERGPVYLLDPDTARIFMFAHRPDIGVVADYALIKPQWDNAAWKDEAAPDVRSGLGIYVAADTGLYLVWFKTPAGAMGEEPVLNWSRVALPGISGRIRAVSYFADAGDPQGDDDAAALDQGRHFLWVADSAGDAYMFSTAGKTHRNVMETGALEDNTYFWQPCGVRHQGTQVMRAFLSPDRPRQADGRLLVGQASRNSPIVVSLYGPYPKPGQSGERSEPLERTDQQKLWNLLVHGDVEALRARFSEGTDAMRVARLFETVADDAHDKLVDFLRRPSPKLALDVLQVETKPLQGEEVARRVGEVLLTWTYALIGALHQVPIPIADKPFDGIVRWLGDVEAKLKADDRLGVALEGETFAREIGVCIRAANKWGIDGWTYGDRKHDLAALERFLLAQAEKCPGLDSRHLDAMVYGAQLLEQRYDIEAEPRSDGMAVRTATKTPGVTAWDLQIDDHHIEETDRLAQPRFAAVSWSHGLAVYHLGREVAKLTQSGWRLDRVWPAAPERFDGGPERYSRGVAITRARDDLTTPLLVVVRRAGSPSSRERVDLVELRDPLVGREGLPGPVVNPRGATDLCQIPEGESVYSILDLEAGLVLLGLKGQSGKARIALLEIPSAKEAVLLLPKVDLEPASPPGGFDAKNPVWTLSTQRRRGSSASEHHVVLGCDDGSVWLLKITRDPKDEPGTSVVKVEVEKVGVLGAAVWAAAVRWMPSASGTDGEMRVFAGGADGSVLAWQSTTPSDGSRTWTPIWATREKTAIGRIHLFDRFSAGDSDADEAARRHILLLTYDGHAVVVMDHPEIEDQTSATGAPLRVPGQRLDRVRLGMPVLASDALRTNFDASPWPRILVASGDGRLRFVCLTRLRGTEERRAALNGISDRWRSEVGLPDLSKPRSGPDQPGPVAPVRASGMRLHAAMSGACETLRLLPVDWLLAEGSSAIINDPLTVPRQLSALVTLAKAWDAAYQGDGRDAHGVRKPFAEILRYCRRTNDPRLFREVVECVLKRMNHDLVRTEDSKRLTAYEIAEALIEVLESTHGLWLGAIDDLDVRLKIVRAKALLDSRVLYRLGRTEFGPRAGHDDRTQKKLEDKRRTVLDLRVTFVSDLVGQGEQLLTLEVIRAVNLTLLRCAKALRTDESTVATASVLDWDTISRFFYRLKAVIARLAHSGAGLSHTLRHEVSRSFALAMCCVPDRLLLLTHLLSEANLSFEMFTRVAERLRALPLLGIRVPKDTPEIFAAATIWRQEDRQPEVIRDRMMMCSTVVAKVSKDRGDLEGAFSRRPDVLAAVFPSSESGGGWRNEDIVRHWAPWHWLLQELYAIADCLDRQPSRLDTSRLAAFAQHLGEHGGPDDDRYTNTRDFWNFHLNSQLAKRWLGWSVASSGASEQALRPELLSELSPTLVKWCEELIEDLGRRLREFRLFEPHASAYGAAAARLLSVARHMPHSAAVLSDIVVGILGHGLLESVAEHVFELAEIARTLDPHRDSRADRGGGVSSAFAAYLDELKKKAADVPRTLLTLKELLANPNLEADQETLQSMFNRHAAIHGRTPWQVGELNPPLTAREASFLLIALAEIDNNDRVHGFRSSPGPTAVVRIEDRRLCIEVVSRTDPTNEENNKLLKEIVDIPTKISQPMPPNPGAIGLSHGTGLYMARLAATLVNWSFRCANYDPSDGVLTTILSSPPKFAASPE